MVLGSNAVAIADRVARQVVDAAILHEEGLERSREPPSHPGRDRRVVRALLAVVAERHGEGQRLEAGDLRAQQPASGQDVGGDAALERSEGLAGAVAVEQVRVVGTDPAPGAGGDSRVAHVCVLLHVPTPAPRHRAQLGPGQVARAGRLGGRGDHEHGRAHAVSRERGIGTLVAVESAVVEGDQDRPVREPGHVSAGEARVLGDRECMEPVAIQHFHLAGELTPGDGVVVSWARIRLDPVVDQDRYDTAVVVHGRLRGGARRAQEHERSQGAESARESAC